MKSQLSLSFQSENPLTSEDVPGCSELPRVFGSVEFCDTASALEEFLSEEFILNTHRTKQVFEE